MNDDNQEREINGLLSALRFYKLSEGVIITLELTDKIVTGDYKINVIPAYQYDA